MQIQKDKFYTENVILHLDWTKILAVQAPENNTAIEIQEYGSKEPYLIEYYDNERRDKVFGFLLKHLNFIQEHSQMKD